VITKFGSHLCQILSGLGLVLVPAGVQEAGDGFDAVAHVGGVVGEDRFLVEFYTTFSLGQNKLECLLLTIFFFRLIQYFQIRPIDNIFGGIWLCSYLRKV